MKKVLSLALALLMLTALLTGCGDGNADTPAPAKEPAQNTAAPDTNEPAANGPVDDTVFTLNYASTFAADSDRNDQVETVLKDKLYEKSGGRIVLEIFNSSTLAGNKDMLEALTSGIADMGVFLTPMYQGQFPYSDLFSIPGLRFGSIAETDEVVRAYTEAYPDELFSTDLKVGVRYSIGTQCVISLTPVTTVSDVKGLTLRAASSGLPFYEAMGAAGVSMAASDVYEGLKLGTINATVTGMEGTKRNKLAEVADYIVPVPCHNGEEMICMSKASYDKLPADLQAVIDETFVEMYDIISVYTQEQEDLCYDACYEMNPDLTVNAFSDGEVAQMQEMGVKLMEAKAAELDAQGLDGTGALNWLKGHAK